MAFRKFAADYLFTGKEMLGSNAVLITDEKGKVHSIVDVAEVSDGIERYNGIISPGFINCHCHLELSHLKGAIPRHTGMVEFLITVMNTRNASDEIIRDFIAYEERYMREKGVVAVGDICNTAHTLEIKKGSDLYFHNFIEAIGFVPATAGMRFGQALETYRSFSDEDQAASIVPHAMYSVSPELFKLINEHEKDALLCVHNQESDAETKFATHGTGNFLQLYRKLNLDISHFKPSSASSLRYTLNYISPEHSLILVHNVHTSHRDIEWVEANRETLPELWWCLCPNANLYINDRLPDVKMLLKENDHLVVGTDSLASNVQLNILEELKTLQLHFPTLKTEQLLQWATINGAKALRISSRYGSFEKGKQPGVVVIHGGRRGMLHGTVSRRVL